MENLVTNPNKFKSRPK